MKHFLIAQCLLLSINIFAQETESKPDFNTYGNANVVASRLSGRWKTNIELTRRLTGKTQSTIDTVQFITDSTARKIIPSKHYEYIKGKPIYLSGYLIVRANKYPFLLTEGDGNTHLLFFRDRNNIRYDDGESFILFIAVSNDKNNDILTTGGDFNNEPFRCWDRIE